MARTTVNLTPRRGLSRKNSYSGLSPPAATDSVLPHTQQSGGLYSHFERSSDEELPNLAITLCRQVDKMMTTWLEKLEEVFKENGGLSERMTALRLGHRKTQQETIEAQAHEIEQLKNGFFSKSNISASRKPLFSNRKLTVARIELQTLLQQLHYICLITTPIHQ